MTLGAYSLTSLQTFKDWLGHTTSESDTIFENLLNATTARIERFIGRQILARDRVEFYDGNVDTLKLRQYPVITCKYVGYGITPAIGVTSTDTTDLAATVQVTADSVILNRTASTGAVTTTTITLSSFLSASLLATEISTKTGFSASTLGDCPTKYLHRVGPIDARQSPAYLTSPSQRATQYRIDSTTGLIKFPFGWRHDDWNECEQEWQEHGDGSDQTVIVDYNAGYATTPDDLAQATLEIAAQAWRARFKDANVNSESLGDYSYTSAVREASDDLLDSLLSSWKEIR